MRFVILIMAVTALTLAACGGTDPGTNEPAQPTLVQTTVAENVEPSEETTTTATMEEEVEAAPSSGGDVSTATVSIAGETYLFGTTGLIAERYNPNFSGGVQVVLRMVDEDEKGMIIADQIVTLDLAIIPSDAGSTAVEVPTTDRDRDWIADPTSLIVDGTQVDDWTIEENRVQGTATFAGTAGEGPVLGSFDVFCVDE